MSSAWQAARLLNSGTSFLKVSAKQSAQCGTNKICVTAWVVFSETFGDRPVRVLRADEIKDWLHALNLSPVSTNNYAVRVGSMFSYGVKRDYLEANLFTGIAKVKSDDEPPEIFTVDELQDLLLVAPPELIPIPALGAFAGLRSAELVRLGWEDIDLKRDFSTSLHESPRLHRGASSRF